MTRRVVTFVGLPTYGPDMTTRPTTGVVISALLLAGCSGGSNAEDATTTSSSTTTTVATSTTTTTIAATTQPASTTTTTSPVTTLATVPPTTLDPQAELAAAVERDWREAKRRSRLVSMNPTDAASLEAARAYRAGAAL